MTILSTSNAEPEAVQESSRATQTSSNHLHPFPCLSPSTHSVLVSLLLSFTEAIPRRISRCRARKDLAPRTPGTDASNLETKESNEAVIIEIYPCCVLKIYSDWILTAGLRFRGPTIMAIRANNRGHQFVPHDVRVIEMTKPDARDPAQSLQRFHKPGAPI